MSGELLPASAAWHTPLKGDTGSNVAGVRIDYTDLIPCWIITIFVVTAAAAIDNWEILCILAFILLQTILFCKQSHPAWPALVLGVGYIITVTNNRIAAIVLPSVAVIVSSAYFLQK